LNEILAHWSSHEEKWWITTFHPKKYVDIKTNLSVN
jgi:hypothetical protein